jgi:hypothetical protein
MKIKLFWKNKPLGGGLFSAGKNAHALEEQINTWLSENPRIRIVDIKQSSSGGSFAPDLWLISVWYEEGPA